jgi:hypothetical protein
MAFVVSNAKKSIKESLQVISLNYKDILTGGVQLITVLLKNQSTFTPKQSIKFISK